MLYCLMSIYYIMFLFCCTAVGNINNYNIILFVHRSRKRSKHHMLFYSAVGDGILVMYDT